MWISIIIGTIIWGILLAFLCRFVSIFATPMAWITSWFVVVFIVFEIVSGSGSGKIEKNIAEELKILEGTWECEDRVIGIQWDDGGTVNAEKNLQTYELLLYDEEGYRYADVDVNFLDKECYYSPYYDEPSNEFEYKIKGKKKIVLKDREGEKYTLKKKSKECYMQPGGRVIGYAP